MKTNREQRSATGEIAHVEPNETNEVLSFPIIEEKEVLYHYDQPKLQEGKITHYIKQIGFNEPREKNFYVLLKRINELNYTFSLSQYYGQGEYMLIFKTEEYEFARTSLEEKSRNELFKVMSSFIETVHDKIPNEIDTIIVDPADASYTKQEIENCIEEIIKSPENKLTREEIMERYKGFEVFDLYRELFNKDFHAVHYNFSSKAKARSRLFKMMFRKHLPNWDIKEDYPGSLRFNLERKTQEPIK